MVPIHEIAVGGDVFFSDDLDGVKVHLQPRPFDLAGLLGRLALRKEYEAVSFGQISKCFNDSVEDIRRRALEFLDAVTDIFQSRAFGKVPRQLHVRLLERPAEAADTVTVLADVAALRFV